MEYNEKLKKKACNELEEYANKSKLSLQDWEAIHMLSDTVKNFNKNEMQILFLFCTIQFMYFYI